MKKIFLFLFFVFHGFLSAGFAAGTLVKIQNGYVPIEQIKEGDSVLAFKSNHAYGYNFDSYPTKKVVNTLVKIKMGDDLLVVAADQKFVLAGSCQSVFANDLKTGDLLMNVGGAVEIDAVETFDNIGEVYTLFVEDIGIFFISKQHVVVFNSPYSVWRSLKNGTIKATTTMFDVAGKVARPLFEIWFKAKYGEKMDQWARDHMPW